MPRSALGWETDPEGEDVSETTEPKKGLSSQAYAPIPPGEKYDSYVPASQSPTEMTV